MKGKARGSLLASTGVAPAQHEVAALMRLLDRTDYVGFEQQCRRMLGRYPTYAVGWNLLGAALFAMGRSTDAVLPLQRAVMLEPGNLEALHNLACVLRDLERWDEAAATYWQAARRQPTYLQHYARFGVACVEARQYAQGVAIFRQLLAMDPASAILHHDLGVALQHMGQMEEAQASLERALQLDPTMSAAYSALLFCLTHRGAADPDDMLVRHQGYGRFFSVERAAHDNLPDPLRRLRVGFVSGDLRNHAVAYFIEPIWAQIDPAQIELFAYANHPVHDEVSKRLRKLVPNWRQVEAMSDAELVNLIRVDGIDLLFDLSGHSAHHRLPVFAQKPAPIQITWLGYPNTTGLTAIDYVLSDRFNAPYGFYERYYVEKFARIPTASTFQPDPRAPQINPLPALSNGYLTFASFHRPSKLGDDVVAVWSRILQRLPDARLWLGNVSDATVQELLMRRFAGNGIVPERLTFFSALPMADYLALHHHVDIALDSWPYSGGTTTNHALWMGVPVLALRGPSRAQCQSAGVLGRLGLDDWVCDDEEIFVLKAMSFAADWPALAALRGGLRQRWQTSPWYQPQRVAAGLAAALRIMWQRWCAGLPAADFEVDAELDLSALIKVGASGDPVAVQADARRGW